MTVERIRQFSRITHKGEGKEEQVADQIAVEEPLEIRLSQDPLAVIMRTPGNDIELTVGLLIAEEIIHSSDDIGTIAHCRDGDDPELENVVNVVLTDECKKRVEAEDSPNKMRRTFLTSSSCGVCGKRSIDTLHASSLPFAEYAELKLDEILQFPDAMKKGQSVFDATGGIHAAAVFNASGELLILREDIGRHNAVDKCVGALALREQLPLQNSKLMVSGRTSFEIIQKALVARIQTVAAVSAPSSLAIELARESRINLCGFVRGQSLNVYAGKSVSKPKES